MCDIYDLKKAQQGGEGVGVIVDRMAANARTPGSNSTNANQLNSSKDWAQNNNFTISLNQARMKRGPCSDITLSTT